MLAGTIVYVYAGHAARRSCPGSSRPGCSPRSRCSAFPAGREEDRSTRSRRARSMRAGRGRARFDRNLVVIGAGSAGLVSAYIAAAVKAKVTLIEKHRMGGDCLNTGCVPSKALIRSARLLSQIRRSRGFGIRAPRAEFDFAEVMERVQRVIRQIEPHDSVERYTALGVECIEGRSARSPRRGRSRSDGEGRRTLTTRAIVIAAGARPFVPPIPGSRRSTSDLRHVWDLRELPRRLVVLGGGPIGCELAQASRASARRSRRSRCCRACSCAKIPEVSEMVRRRFAAEGIDVLDRHKAKQVMVEDGARSWSCEHEGREMRIEFDELLCAVGRVRQHRGLRAGGARHPGDQARAPSRPTSTCRRSIRTSTPAATSPARTSSRTPPRTRPGTRRSTRSSAVQEIPGRLFGDPVGHLHRPGSRARGPERDRGEGARTSRTRSRPTASTISTARSPTARRTAWSRC